MSENTTIKKYPQYTGSVQTGENTKVGKISLWNNTEPTSEKSPLMTGQVEIETEPGVKRSYRVALWKYIER